MNATIDTLILIGMLSFPLYLLYWVGYHVHFRAWHRLWGAFVSLIATFASTTDMSLAGLAITVVAVPMFFASTMCIAVGIVGSPVRRIVPIALLR